MMHQDIAIVEGADHSLKRVLKDDKKIILFWENEGDIKFL